MSWFDGLNIIGSDTQDPIWVRVWYRFRWSMVLTFHMIYYRESWSEAWTREQVAQVERAYQMKESNYAAIYDPDTNSAYSRDWVENPGEIPWLLYLVLAFVIYNMAKKWKR